MAGAGRPKTGGRKKGAQNKTTKLIKDMVTEALDRAGGVDYLVTVAEENPTAFCTLIGKVLPLNVVSDDGSMSPPKTIVICGPDE